MKRMMQFAKGVIVLGAIFGVVQLASATEKTIDVYQLNEDASKQGMGEKIGTITFQDSKKGLKISTQLKGLPPGKHGFHIHENPTCEGEEKDNHYQPGLAAGNHLDPSHTGKHLGPYKHGHLGDLPVLVVNNEGMSNYSEVAPRLTLTQIEGHSIVIHKGGDNYSDEPLLGGGGERVACGVIK